MATPSTIRVKRSIKTLQKIKLHNLVSKILVPSHQQKHKIIANQWTQIGNIDKTQLVHFIFNHHTNSGDCTDEYDYITIPQHLLSLLASSSSIKSHSNSDTTHAFKSNEVFVIHNVSKFYGTLNGKPWKKKRIKIDDFGFKIHLYPNGLTSINDGFIQYFIEWTKMTLHVSCIVVCVHLFCVETSTTYKDTKIFNEIGDSEGFVWLLPSEQCLNHSSLHFGADIQILQHISHTNTIQSYVSTFKPHKVMEYEWKWNQIQHILHTMNHSTHHKLFFTDNTDHDMFCFGIESESTPNDTMDKRVSIFCNLLHLPPEVARVKIVFKVKMGYPEYCNTVVLDYESTQCKLKLIPLDTEWLLTTEHEQLSIQLLVEIIQIFSSKQEDKDTVQYIQGWLCMNNALDQYYKLNHKELKNKFLDYIHRMKFNDVLVECVVGSARTQQTTHWKWDLLHFDDEFPVLDAIQFTNTVQKEQFVSYVLRHCYEYQSAPSLDAMQKKVQSIKMNDLHFIKCEEKRKKRLHLAQTQEALVESENVIQQKRKEMEVQKHKIIEEEREIKERMKILTQMKENMENDQKKVDGMNAELIQKREEWIARQKAYEMEEEEQINRDKCHSQQRKKNIATDQCALLKQKEMRCQIKKELKAYFSVPKPCTKGNADHANHPTEMASEAKQPRNELNEAETSTHILIQQDETAPPVHVDDCKTEPQHNEDHKDNDCSHAAKQDMAECTPTPHVQNTCQINPINTDQTPTGNMNEGELGNMTEVLANTCELSNDEQPRDGNDLYESEDAIELMCKRELERIRRTRMEMNLIPKLPGELSNDDLYESMRKLERDHDIQQRIMEMNLPPKLPDDLNIFDDFEHNDWERICALAPTLLQGYPKQNDDMEQIIDLARMLNSPTQTETNDFLRDMNDLCQVDRLNHSVLCTDDLLLSDELLLNNNDGMMNEQAISLTQLFDIDNPVQQEVNSDSLTGDDIDDSDFDLHTRQAEQFLMQLLCENPFTLLAREHKHIIESTPPRYALDDATTDFLHHAMLYLELLATIHEVCPRNPEDVEDPYFMNIKEAMYDAMDALWRFLGNMDQKLGPHIFLPLEPSTPFQIRLYWQMYTFFDHIYVELRNYDGSFQMDNESENNEYEDNSTESSSYSESDSDAMHIDMEQPAWSTCSLSPSLCTTELKQEGTFTICLSDKVKRKEKIKLDAFTFKICLNQKAKPNTSNQYMQYLIKLTHIPSDIQSVVIYFELCEKETNTEYRCTKTVDKSDIPSVMSWYHTLLSVKKCKKHKQLEFVHKIQILQTRTADTTMDFLDFSGVHLNLYGNHTDFEWFWSIEKRMLTSMKYYKHGTLYYDEMYNGFYVSMSNVNQNISISLHLFKLTQRIEKIHVTFQITSNIKRANIKCNKQHVFDYNNTDCMITLNKKQSDVLLHSTQPLKFTFNVKINTAWWRDRMDAPYEVEHVKSTANRNDKPKVKSKKSSKNKRNAKQGRKKQKRRKNHKKQKKKVNKRSNKHARVPPVPNAQMTNKNSIASNHGQRIGSPDRFRMENELIQVKYLNRMGPKCVKLQYMMDEYKEMQNEMRDNPMGGEIGMNSTSGNTLSTIYNINRMNATSDVNAFQSDINDGTMPFIKNLKVSQHGRHTKCEY